MKGLIFTILTYGLVTAFCFIFKFLKVKLSNNKIETKGSEQQSAPQIYYVTNDKKRKPARKKQSPDIALKGSIINKTDD